MSNFIKSYFGNNFMGSESNISYTAGMNFTNLIIAIPLLTTFILLVIDSIRSPRKPKILDTKFQIITLISYVLFVAIAIYYKNLPDVIINIYSWLKLLLINSSVIIVLAYIPFMFFAWCIYDDNTQNAEKNIDKYENSELKETIKNKITQLQNEDKSHNILINGHWGSGKTNFTKNKLSKSINSSIYISCTDYPDMFELVNALVYKSNNFIMRQLIRFSLGKLLSIISKTELRQYIGNKKVIILDEFERLVDYNKIDHMHIVSLIQYLNSEKNCICILVANEDHLNNANKFTNVREKLISYTYHYKIPFDDVIKIIQNRNSYKIGSDKFANIYQEIKSLYHIDNNIRIIEHLYIKIDQIYTTQKGFIKFKQSNKNILITEEEFFSQLFSNVLDLINPLYYLYLKNPYNLKAIETLAVVYKKTEEESNILAHYIDETSIQNLALKYLNKDIISYKNGNNELYDASYDLNYIITNQNFENINANLITDFLGNEKIVSQLIFFNKDAEYGITPNQNIKIFMRLFKETFCEDDDQKLINDYFSSINVLEQRFSRLVDDIELPWDYSIVTDYIAYCQYVDQSYSHVAYINALIIDYLWQESTEKKNTLLVVINEFYKIDINKKIISIVYERTAQETLKKGQVSRFIELISQIAISLLESNKSSEDYQTILSFMSLSYYEVHKSLTLKDIKLCNDKMIEFSSRQMTDKAVADKFFECFDRFNHAIITHHQDQENIEYFIQLIAEIIQSLPININSLKRMNKSYAGIKNYLEPQNIEHCNENMINLITPQNYNNNFIEHLFKDLNNFNETDFTIYFPSNSLTKLVNKIKEIFNTTTLQKKFIETYKNHKFEIPNQVAKILQAELDAEAEPSNPTQEESDI